MPSVSLATAQRVMPGLFEMVDMHERMLLESVPYTSDEERRVRELFQADRQAWLDRHLRGDAVDFARRTYRTAVERAEISRQARRRQA